MLSPRCDLLCFVHVAQSQTRRPALFGDAEMHQATLELSCRASDRVTDFDCPLPFLPQAFGLIVRRINDEPFDVSSVPGSRAVTIKFIIPNSRMGTV